MKVASTEIPEDCWELILNRLDHKELQDPSLVCKQFLSITDRLRRKLVVTGSVFYSNNCEALFRALQRFRNLIEIELREPVFGDKDDVNYPIRRIASSGLDLQALSLVSVRKPPTAKTFRKLGSAMNNLKILSCGCYNSFRNHDLVAIADALPWLEELDLHLAGCEARNQHGRRSRSAKHVLTDSGIEVMSRKLARLRKIDISCQGGCSDRSLIALASNCEFLQELRCSMCPVTEHGICFALRHCRNLVSFTAWRQDVYGLPDDPCTFENSMIYARSLRQLDLQVKNDYGRLLYSISAAGIPLEKIVLYDDSGLSFEEFSTFLLACLSLKHLVLCSINFLDDNSMRDVCRFLPNLVSIELSACSKLTHATFFILAKECPALSEIGLTFIEREDDNNFGQDLVRNHKIKSVDLSRNEFLTDEVLKEVCAACPNLERLELWGTKRLTTEGIGEILDRCSQIKYLTSPRICLDKISGIRIGL